MKYFLNRILLVILLSLSAFITPCRGEEKPLYAFLGDSNLWIGGDDCSGEKAWSHELCKAQNARGVSFARSGATWTCTRNTKENVEAYSEVIHDDNVIFNQMMRMLAVDWEKDYGKEPDVIFIAAGTNDAWFEARRPGIWDISPQEAWSLIEVLIDAEPSKLTSLSAAVVNTLCIIAESFENAKIVVVAPPLTTACPEERIHKVAQTLQDSLGELAESVTFIRLDTPDIINPATEQQTHTATTDGTHTSTKGAKIIANKIISLLK